MQFEKSDSMLRSLPSLLAPCPGRAYFTHTLRCTTVSSLLIAPSKNQTNNHMLQSNEGSRSSLLLRMTSRPYPKLQPIHLILSFLLSGGLAGSFCMSSSLLLVWVPPGERQWLRRLFYSQQVGQFSMFLHSTRLFKTNVATLLTISLRVQVKSVLYSRQVRIIKKPDLFILESSYIETVQRFFFKPVITIHGNVVINQLHPQGRRLGAVVCQCKLSPNFEIVRLMNRPTVGVQFLFL